LHPKTYNIYTSNQDKAWIQQGDQKGPQGHLRTIIIEVKAKYIM